MSFESIKKSIKNAIFLKNPFDEMFHLWYIYLYIFLMIISPLIYLMIKIMNSHKVIKITFFICSFLLLMINDCIHNKIGFSNSTLRGAIPAIIFNIYGYYLYKYLNKNINLQNRIKNVFFVALFILLAFIRALLLYKNLKINVSDDALLFWYSLFGLCMSIVLVLIIFKIGIDIKGKLESFIVYLANNCFGIYLIHLSIINLIGINNIYRWLGKQMRFNITTDIVYTILVVSAVFLISCLLVSLYYALIKKIKYVVREKFKR